MKLDPFQKLIGGLVIAFGLPVILLILLPFIESSKLEPIPYGEGDEVEGGVAAYPDKNFYRVGASDYGRQIYAAEGRPHLEQARGQREKNKTIAKRDDHELKIRK